MLKMELKNFDRLFPRSITTLKFTLQYPFSNFRYQDTILANTPNSTTAYQMRSQSQSPRNSPQLQQRYRSISTATRQATSNSNYHRNYGNNNNELLVPPSNNQKQPNTPQRSRATANLLASLDKSILQIRDWLTLLESMIKKDRVDLSDRGHIYHMLERQKVSDFRSFKHPVRNLLLNYSEWQSKAK